MIRKLPAYRVYLVTAFAASLFFTMMGMISAIYRVESGGLNPLQLVLVGTVLEAAVFLFEIPTGIVADLYSRRLSIIIGYTLIGLGFMLEGALPLFATILLAQVVWGVGYTFISGASDAWIADEAGEARLPQIYLRGAQLGQLGALLGIVASAGLGTIQLKLPILLGGGLMIALALFLVLFMPETAFAPVPQPERTTWQKMGHTLRDGIGVVRGRPLLILMLAVATIYGLSSEGLDRLWEAHFLANFSFPGFADLDPVIWFGLINVGTLLLSIIATELVRRRMVIDSQAAAARALLLVNAPIILSVAGFGLAGNFTMALGMYWSLAMFRSTNGPLFNSWINRGLESRVRATVLSMQGQADALGQFVGGPFIGVVATALGLRVSMVVVALLLSPVMLLYARARRMPEPPLTAAPAGESRKVGV